MAFSIFRTLNSFFKPICLVSYKVPVPVRSFRATIATNGLEEFFDKKKAPGELTITGRGWTVTDLRRKVGKLLITNLDRYILSLICSRSY